VVGLEKTFKYSDSDNFTLGVEYFRNGLGYSDRTHEMLALLQKDRPFFSAGRDYLGAYWVLPQPGSFDNTSVTLTSLHNLSDKTSALRLIVAQTILKDISLELSLGRCFGSSGELCFSVPGKILDTYGDLAKADKSGSLQDSIGFDPTELPRKPARTTASLGLRMGF
jgi:hypothetical protein